ncbi:MAG: inositol monophosphatase family protein [Nitrososphaerota archaeon]
MNDSFEDEILEVLEDALNNARKEVFKILGKEEAKRIISKHFEDITTLIDDIAEKAIFHTIKEKMSNAILISEEAGLVKFGSNGKYIFIIDPLDGSTNAIRGYSCFSGSIAVSYDWNSSSIFAGMVMNYVTGDIFSAKKNEGAYLNNKKVYPSNIKKVEEAMIALDLNVRKKIPGYAKRISPIIENSKYIRFLGTDALEISFVSAGICDAFIDLRGFLRLTDFAAAAFIVKEAGGIVLNDKREPLNINISRDARSSIIAASTIDLYNDILNYIA